MSSTKSIRVAGAREHNLKNISVEIPRDQLVVITGLSGSGKSTLAFDTIFAEGQRKYIESLSTYARQFLDQLQKPDLDEIEGLPPTIAIEQRSASSNPRSTVATTTEIYDYLRVLFARAGTPHCWKCGRPIASQSASQIVDAVMRYPAGTKMMILSPLIRGQKGEHKEIFAGLHKQGFVRARVDGELIELTGPASFPQLKKTFAHNVDAVIDRVIVKPEIRSRIADSIETALRLAQGLVVITTPDAENKWVDQVFSEKFACPEHPEVSLPELEPRLFSFNSPHGACAACHGLGTTFEFDPEMIIPDESVSLENGAIEAWRKNGKRMNIYYARVLRTFCRDFGIAYSMPIKDIPRKVRDVLLFGTDAKGDCGTGTWFEGVIPNLQRRFANTESEWVKSRLHQYMSEQPCEVCRGTRLKQEAMCVRLHAQSALSVEPGSRERAVSAPTSDCVSTGGSVEAVEAPPAKKSGKNGKNGKNGRAKKSGAAATMSADATTPASAAQAAAVVSSGDPVLPGLSIHDVTRLSVDRAREFFGSLTLTKEGHVIAEPIVREIRSRLGFMADVGLGYLTLDRKTGTLSGGEAQRIRLATQVGSGLVGVCYVLDEPTIGLHQRDNTRLIRTLLRLRDIGNTVIMVEHDEDCIRSADYLVDIGPGAGAHGGHVVVTGVVKELLGEGTGKAKAEGRRQKDEPTVDRVVGTNGGQCPPYTPRAFGPGDSLTLQYLLGHCAIVSPPQRRSLDPDKNCLEIKGCRENNLKNIDVRIPLGGLVLITGVSGSGKSTLINQTLLPALKRKLLGSKVKAGEHKTLAGTQKIDKVIEIDQSPIGRTPRSNPATYTGVFDEIRRVFSMTREARLHGYEAGRFSFNVKGGRCEACQGQGTKLIEMHFLPDVYVVCEVCHGRRYNAETLEVHFRGKSIADVLEMTVEEGLAFFDNFPKIRQMLQALNDVGLGYIKLGQPSTQLSGGEAQRVKLASELGKTATGHTLYVLDEPTTGLHFADIHNLLNVLNRLADMGNTIVVIEHNLDVIKCADWIIDLGPEGGDAGGRVVATGTPEQIVTVPQSHTAAYLKPKLTISPQTPDCAAVAPARSRR